MLIRYAALVATVMTLAPNELWAAQPQASYRADALMCANAGKALEAVSEAAQAIASNGDAAQAEALTFATSGTISYDDSQKLMNACDSLSDSVNAMMTSVSALDSVFPASSDVGLQMLHLKIGLAADPIKPFGVSLLQHMMATINCDLGDGLAECETKLVLPLFATTDASGAVTHPYAVFRGKVVQSVANLKSYLQTQVCADTPGPIAAVN